MSSYYTAAELERRRQEALRQELNRSIEKLRARLRSAHETEVQVSEAANIVLTVFDSDAGTGGSGIFEAVCAGLPEEERVTTRREITDLSPLLLAAEARPSRTEREIDDLIRRIDERPVLTQNDAESRTRLIAAVAGCLQTDADIGEKLDFVRARVSSYLRDAAVLTDDDRERLRAQYFTYCALCSMSGIAPTETVPYRIEEKIAEMTARLEKEQEDAYIMQVITEIMEELHCHVKGEAVLEQDEGLVFSVEGTPLCDVFVSRDSSGILFEPVGDLSDGSLERRRSVEQSANSICAMYTELERRAAERGVILRRVVCAAVDAGEMHMRSEIQTQTADKRKRRAAAQKPKAMHAED